MMSEKVVMEIKELVKDYGGKGFLTKVLKGIDLTIYKNDFIAIMGPSGSGKTTLLNILSTIDKPTHGIIKIDGQDISKISNKNLSDLRKEKIGFIFQDYNLLDTMTLQDNIALPLSLNGVDSKTCLEKTNSLANLFGLKNHLKKYPYQLSGGQKQRGATCRALISNPEIIFADEPTGALDSKSSKDLLECLKMVNDQEKATILMVTHDATAASFSHRVIFLKDGQVYTSLTRGEMSQDAYYREILDTQRVLGGVVDEAE